MVLDGNQDIMPKHGTGRYGFADPFITSFPGFVITGDEVGLGDVVQRVTYAMCIRPCGGCERRAAAMNRWMVFTR